MSKFFKLVDPAPPTGTERRDFFARGDSWSIVQNSEKYILEYISGELAGRLKTIEISLEDARRLADDDTNVDDILIKYGVY